MDAQSLLVAARIARLLDVVGSDAADRLAVLPLGLPLSPGTVPGTAAWEEGGRSKVAEAAFALLCNETGTRSTTWRPPNGRRVWEVYREVLYYAVVGRRGLTGVEREQLTSAEELLFDEVDGDLVPTAEYEAYTDHAKRIDDLREAAARARLAGDDLQANTLDARLRAAEAEWVVTGHKETIGPAIATMRRLRADDPAAIWVRARHALQAVDVQVASMFGDFYPTPLTPLRLDEVEWQRVEITAADVEPLLAEGAERFPAVEEEDLDSSSLAGLERLGFRVTVAALHRDWLLTEQVLTEPVWDWPDDRTPLAAADGPEMMGAFADGIVFVTDIEAEFTSGARAVRKMAKEAQAVTAFGPLVLSNTVTSAGAARLQGVRVLDSDEALTLLTRSGDRRVTSSSTMRRTAGSHERRTAGEGEVRASLLRSYAKLLPSTREVGKVTARRLRSGTVANVHGVHNQKARSLLPGRRLPRPKTRTRPPKKRSRRSRTPDHPRNLDLMLRRGYVWVKDKGGVGGHWERKSAPRKKEPHRYSGRVTSGDQPVLGAEVVLLAKDHEEVARTRTGSGGRFDTEAPPGQYLLQVSAEGFLPVSANLPLGDQEDLHIKVEHAPETWQVVAFTRFDLQPPLPNPDPSLAWG